MNSSARRGTPALAALAALVLVGTGLTPTAYAAPIGVPADGGSGYVRGFGYAGDPENGYVGGEAASVPQLVRGHRMQAIAAGTGLSVSLGVDGRVYAWGSAGYGATRVPANLTGVEVTAIAASGQHVLALTSAGRVIGWGEDDHGESTVPAALRKKKVVEIAAGGHHSLALTSDGTVVAWGDDSFHQSTVPAALAGQKVVSIAGGALHSLAATADGRVVAWGSDRKGEIDLPAALQGQQVTEVAAGYYDSLALTASGHVVPWGYDEDGQEEGVPAGGIAGIAAGQFHHVAVGLDGRFHGWGQDHDGEVSDPYANEPTRAVAAGFNHTLVLTDPTTSGFFADNPPGSVFAGVHYSYAFAAFGNPTPVFSVGSGALPPGLTLSTDGILSGVPTTVGTYRFTVAATHGGNADAVTPERTITVEPGYARVVVVSGDRQSTAVDTPFAHPLVVRVVGDHGQPLRRFVQMSISSPPSMNGAATFQYAYNGLVTGGYTDADGLFVSPTVLAGHPAGLNTVKVTLVDDEATAELLLATDDTATPAADLGVTLAAPATAKTHHQVTVRVTTGNRGPSTADFATTTLSWPSGWRLVDAAGSTVSGRTASWDGGLVAPGARSTYSVHLVTSRHRGPQTLRATTTAGTPDPSIADNTATAAVALRR